MGGQSSRLLSTDRIETIIPRITRDAEADKDLPAQLTARLKRFRNDVGHGNGRESRRVLAVDGLRLHRKVRPSAAGSKDHSSERLTAHIRA